MDFPREHWAQISSTNPLERVNKEIKRRSDVVGIFPNDAAIVRLVGALMIETNDEWAVARRYMGLESLPRITDTHQSGCPRRGYLISSSPSEGRPSYTTPRGTTEKVEVEVEVPRRARPQILVHQIVESRPVIRRDHALHLGPWKGAPEAEAISPAARPALSPEPVGEQQEHLQDADDRFRVEPRRLGIEVQTEGGRSVTS